MNRLLAAAAAAMLCVSTVDDAAAQTIVSAENPDQLVTIIQGLGFQARLDTDGVGDPMIRSSAGGVSFNIIFYDCTNNRSCKSLHFSVGYDLANGTTLQKVDSWNRAQRFASAYRDDEDDPFLQMDVNMEGGVTKANFEKTFDLWQHLKADFEEHIGFRDQ